MRERKQENDWERKWKRELRQAFEPPAPIRKKEFIRGLEKPVIGPFAFLMIQVGYLRKWVWLVSAAIFFSSLAGAAVLSEDVLWWISAWTPLLALTLIVESGRSESYAMVELEMATRFSLKSVLLARMGILGTENLLILCLLWSIGSRSSLFGPVQAGLYMLMPFLLTAFTGLSVMRRFRGREAAYLCGGAAFCIGFCAVFLHNNMPQLYGENYLFWWAAAAIALCIGMVKRYYQFIKGMEDFIWNLS